MHKKLRAGFVGKDSMRDKADRLMQTKEKDCQKLAAGGVAKIRHKQATKNGSPLPASKMKRNCKG